MKVKTAYKLDYDLLQRLKDICKNRNVSINELLTLAANCYDCSETIKTRQNKQQVSICIDDSIIKKIEDIAKQQNVKIIEVVTDIFKQFLQKNLL